MPDDINSPRLRLDPLTLTRVRQVALADGKSLSATVADLVKEACTLRLEARTRVAMTMERIKAEARKSTAGA